MNLDWQGLTGHPGKEHLPDKGRDQWAKHLPTDQRYQRERGVRVIKGWSWGGGKEGGPCIKGSILTQK